MKRLFLTIAVLFSVAASAENTCPKIEGTFKEFDKAIESHLTSTPIDQGMIYDDGREDGLIIVDGREHFHNDQSSYTARCAAGTVIMDAKRLNNGKEETATIQIRFLDNRQNVLEFSVKGSAGESGSAILKRVEDPAPQ